MGALIPFADAFGHDLSVVLALREPTTKVVGFAGSGRDFLGRSHALDQRPPCAQYSPVAARNTICCTVMLIRTSESFR